MWTWPDRAGRRDNDSSVFLLCLDRLAVSNGSIVFNVGAGINGPIVVASLSCVWD